MNFNKESEIELTENIFIIFKRNYSEESFLDKPVDLSSSFTSNDSVYVPVFQDYISNYIDRAILNLYIEYENMYEVLESIAFRLNSKSLINSGKKCIEPNDIIGLKILVNNKFENVFYRSRAYGWEEVDIKFPI